MKGSSAGSVVFKYRIHWHVWLIHFPISFFLAAFIFQILHLFTQSSDSFENAGNAMLISGAAVMIPAVITGWFTWKHHYGGIWAEIFPRKIIIAFIMLGLSILMAAVRTAAPDMFENELGNPWHWAYLLGIILLTAGAALEGLYGIRLSHK